MNGTVTGPVLSFELRKLARATVTKVATVASLFLVLVTATGGYAAAVHGGNTEMGRKARSMVEAAGWEGYIVLAATAVGVVSVLIVGFVFAWVFGREFTDGTVVGLFALPVSTGAVGLAKMLATLVWAFLVALLEAVLVGFGGLALDLPAEGFPRCVATLLTVGITLALSMLVIPWIATVTFGYLGGIAATLAIVAVTNIAAGFGVGRYLPWAIPTLWAASDGNLAPGWLVLPGLVAGLGAVATWLSWRNLQLGNR